MKARGQGSAAPSPAHHKVAAPAHFPRALRFELTVALSSIALLVMTLVSSDWIETVFHLDPDGGSGLIELGIVVMVSAAGLISFTSAWAKWRRGKTRRMKVVTALKPR